MINTLSKPIDLEWELKQEFWRKLSHTHIQKNPSCELCGWQDSRYMRVVTLSNIYHEESLDLQTRCLFCYHEHRLSLCPEGTIIYCPEITQSQLNWFIHTQWALSYILDKNADYTKSFSARAQLRVENVWLDSRKEIVDKFFGCGLSDAKAFAECMAITDVDTKNDARSLIADLRFIPKKEGYLEQISYWGEGIYNQIFPHEHEVASDFSHKLASLSFLK